MFEMRFVASNSATLYDVAPDGNRFVFVRNQVGQSSEQMNLLLHWFDNLHKQVSPGTSGAR